MIMQPSSSPHVVIIGAGIAGLTSALCFLHFGYRVTVIEQKPQLGEAGAGIQLSPNAMHVLRALGIENKLLMSADQPASLDMRDGRSGQKIFSIPLSQQYLAKWGAPYLHMHRSDLITHLSDALLSRSPESLVLGKSAQSWERRGAQIHLRCEDGDAIEADLLIGADGIRSTLRQALFPHIQPHYSGQTAWRFTVAPNPHTNIPSSACVWTGSGRHAVTYPLRHGRLINFVGVVERTTASSNPLAEDWTRRGTREEALKDFAEWHPDLLDLIDRAEAHYVWALHDHPPLTQWYDQRLIFLGDACHPLLPFMAQGAAMAIEDSYVLARLAHGSSDWAGLGREFQALRSPRLHQIRRATRRNGWLFHLSGPPKWGAQKLLRIADRISPQLLLWHQDRLYRHRVTLD